MSNCRWCSITGIWGVDNKMLITNLFGHRSDTKYWAAVARELSQQGLIQQQHAQLKLTAGGRIIMTRIAFSRRQSLFCWDYVFFFWKDEFQGFASNIKAVRHKLSLPRLTWAAIPKCWSRSNKVCHSLKTSPVLLQPKLSLKSPLICLSPSFSQISVHLSQFSLHPSDHGVVQPYVPFR